MTVVALTAAATWSRWIAIALGTLAAASALVFVVRWLNWRRSVRPVSLRTVQLGRRAARVFVSYASCDRRRLIPFFRELEVAKPPDLEIFWDYRIRTGAQWAEVIPAELLRADVLLCVYSRNYFASRWCASEWAYFESQPADPLARKPIRSEDLHRLMVRPAITRNLQNVQVEEHPLYRDLDASAELRKHAQRTLADLCSRQGLSEATAAEPLPQPAWVWPLVRRPAWLAAAFAAGAASLPPAAARLSARATHVPLGVACPEGTAPAQRWCVRGPIAPFRAVAGQVSARCAPGRVVTCHELTALAREVEVSTQEWCGGDHANISDEEFHSNHAYLWDGRMPAAEVHNERDAVVASVRCAMPGLRLLPVNGSEPTIPPLPRLPTP